jgi:L-threonylcarbamoyladenylate synthase
MKLVTRFWPGPLTIVAQHRTDSAICDLACAGLSTVALRAPTHPVARALIAAARVPLAAPSANKSGHVSPTLAAHAAADFGDEVDLILDGGPCALGLESTIVGFSDTGPILLRQGALPREEIEAVIGPLKIAGKHDPVAAPGMLARHYAPRAKLRLNAVAAEAGETFLAFGQNAEGALNLSQTGSLTEAAANLFAYLRRLDDAGVTAIAVAPIPETGLGAAINDRLSRAAEGR